MIGCGFPPPPDFSPSQMVFGGLRLETVEWGAQNQNKIKYMICIVFVSVKITVNHQTCVFSQLFLPPGRRLLLTLGMEMGSGKGGDHSKILLDPFRDHFRTPDAKQLCFSNKNQLP